MGTGPAIELCNFPRLIKRAIMVYNQSPSAPFTPKPTDRLNVRLLGGEVQLTSEELGYFGFHLRFNVVFICTI